MSSALLIPSNQEEPVRRIDVSGLESLQAAVGGNIEAVPFRGEHRLTVYVHMEGKFECEPNPRATRLLGPGLFAGDFVAGPALICGFDPDEGENVDLPGDFEQRFLEAGRELRDPDREKHHGRTIEFEWDLHTDEDGKKTMAVLRVGHHTAGVSMLAGTRHPNEFYAVLQNETEEHAHYGSVRGFTLGKGIGLGTRECGRYSQKGLQAFSVDALETLRAAYADSNPQVTRYFQVQTGAAL